MRSLNHDFVFRLPAFPSAVAQLVTMVAVAGVGGGLLMATTTQHEQRVVASVASRVLRRPVTSTSRSAAHDRVVPLPSSAAPRATQPVAMPAAAARARAHRAHGRWLPTGTGIWIYQWVRSDGGNTRVIVARARAAQLSTLYVRIGSSHDGFRGAGVLRALLPAIRGTALHVVAWDFPVLNHPMRDAARLARAAWILRRSGSSVSAVAPDIETPAEGTHLSGQRVAVYLRTLRAWLPHDVAILTAVPWPSRFRVGRYPYGTVAAGSDAILPMAYWYNNSPVRVTTTSMRFLRRFHRPVLPVGQGYDGRLDVPSLPHNNLRLQVPAFFATAHRFGARGVSLWSWQAAPPVAWGALKSAHRFFPAQPAAD